MVSKDSVSLPYPGTRAWLDDETLTLTYYNKCCNCCDTVMGEKAIDLQGTLDYGYILDDISVDNKMGLSSWGKICCCPLFLTPSPKLWNVKGAIEAVSANKKKPMPQYRQVGNIDPAKAEGLFKEKSDTTYLVLRIMRAKSLAIPYADEFKEVLNPSVTVEWMGIKKSTRVVRSSNDPYWDDEIYFKIPDKRCPTGKMPRKFEEFPADMRKSIVTVSLWDNDGFAKTCLGYCESTFDDMYFKRKQGSVVCFASNGKPVEKYWMWDSEEMGIVTPFAGNLEEHKKKKTDKDEKEEEEEQDHNKRYVNFQAYFDRPDTISGVPLVPRPPGTAPKKVKDWRKGLDHNGLSRASTYWNEMIKLVPDRHVRFFPFYGKDEYTGKFHFLPTFLKPLNPPKDIREFHNLLYFIYSIECNKRNDPIYDPVDTTKVLREVWSWADPYFFMDKRKGDVRDHCILLCNFLLGQMVRNQNFDAYVCTGTVRTKKQSKGEAHTWVMTREMHKEKRIVRFWETTNGKTYCIEDPMLFDYIYPEQAKKALEQLEEAQKVQEAKEREERYRL